jgi:hypothetical protein
VLAVLYCCTITARKSGNSFTSCIRIDALRQLTRTAATDLTERPRLTEAANQNKNS